jgi:hypothetical protein
MVASTSTAKPDMIADTKQSRLYWTIAERSGEKRDPKYDNFDIIELEQYARTGAYRVLAKLADLEIVQMWSDGAYHVFAWHPRLRVIVFFPPPDVASSLRRAPMVATNWGDI